MLTTDIIKAAVWEEGSPRLFARLMTEVNWAKAPVLQAYFTTNLTMKVLTNAGQVGTTQTITIASVIHDTYIGTDFDSDGIGYNFAYRLNGSTFLPDGDQDYRVEFYLTFTGGEMAPLVFLLRTQNLLGR